MAGVSIATGVVATDFNGTLSSGQQFLAPADSNAAPGYSWASSPGSGMYLTASGPWFAVSGSGAQFGIASGGGFGILSASAIGWVANPTTAPDLTLFRDAAHTLAQRNGVNAQTFRVYRTFTDASNYERISLSFNGTAMQLASEAAGTGTIRSLDLVGQANAGWRMQTNALVPLADNLTDIGITGSQRVRDYFGAGKITSAGPTSGIGYATGAGGTVTQITSKATGVTLNTVVGEITLNAAALAASTTVSFVLTNSAIAATDLLVLNHSTTGTFGAYTLNAHGAAAGSITIDVRNVSLGALSEAIVIRYAVIKGVTS